MHVNKLQRLRVARVRVKNPWEPQIQGEFAPTHRVFSTDLHWTFMRKTGWGEKTILEGAGLEERSRRGKGTKPCQDPSCLRNKILNLLGEEQKEIKASLALWERQETILSGDH